MVHGEVVGLMNGELVMCGILRNMRPPKAGHYWVAAGHVALALKIV